MKKIKKFICTPKLNKPVVIPSRKLLLSILEETRPHVVNKVLTVGEIIGGLGEFIGSNFRVDVTHAETVEVELNDIELNAYYDSGLDEYGDIPIELYLLTNPHDSFIILSDEEFDIIMRRIADSLIHEVIHMKQSRARDFLEVDDMAYTQVDDEVEEAQLYLGAYDEIDAYGYNIACELLDRHDLQTSLKKLEKPTAITMEDSINLWAYINTFARDPNHPVIRKLIKRVYKTLQKIGKTDS